MEEYVLIMRHEDGSKIASPEQMQTWMKQTMDWIGSISAQNKFVSGTGLPFADARVVKTTSTGKVKKQLSLQKAALCCRGKAIVWR